jgi:hypothetical protein
MTQEMNIQWISISANCFVHSFMYYYYFISSFGVQVWWKKYLTQLQIFQFIITEALNVFWGIAQFYLGWGCAGTNFGFAFGHFILISFLILFINFYMSAYKKPQGDNKKLVNELKKKK